jgi:hypothetical protein
MTANIMRRATVQHGLRPVHHHLAVAVSVVVAVIVAMVLAGSLVRAVASPPISSSTPGQVRLPTPRPLPPVHMPSDDRSSP